MTEINANYFFQDGPDRKHPFLMLHGTGGTERELLPMAQFVNADSPAIGIRGRISEQGMTRYFLHNEEGGFDLDSLSKETDWLLEQFELIAKKLKLKPEDFTVLGYSNGANVAAYSLLEKQPKFKKAILYHPMALKATDKFLDKSGDKAWLSHGDKDPICSIDNFGALTSFLEASKVDVTVFNHPEKHNITRDEMVNSKKWYEKNLWHKFKHSRTHQFPFKPKICLSVIKDRQIFNLILNW